MATSPIVVGADNVSVVDGNTFFEVQFIGKCQKVNRDLIKNKKNVLEMLATMVFRRGSDKVKKFKEKKSELVTMVTPHIIFNEKENPDDWERVGSSKMKFKLPAGRYYIGDLCDVMKDEVYHGIWGEKFGYDDGIYNNIHGAHFAMRGTEWGDGMFVSDCGKDYPVDAGHIGIAHVSLCKHDVDKDDIWEFPEEFSCTFNGRTYSFQHGPYIMEKKDDDDD